MSYQEDRLIEIANAIREKDGTNDPIKATDFANRILYIPSGGGGDDELLNAIISRGSYTKDLTIPNSVTSIGNNAFYNYSGLTGSLIIPNSVTSIGYNAFYFCSGFTGSLTLPNSVTSIGNYAFRNCSGFTGNLTLPNSVTSIGTYAFYGCSGFTGAVFDGQVPTLNSNAFNGCTAILEYDFTNCTTVPSLSSTNAFQGINANCQIKVPLALEAAWKAATNWATYADYIVGGELDEYYYQVEQVLISANRLQYLDEAWESRNQITVDASGNVTGVTGTLNDIVIPKEALAIPDVSTYDSSPFYPYRESAKSLTLPSNLGLIGTYAFNDCSGFTGSLTIPNSVTSIGKNAFNGCSGFTGSLTIPNSVTSIENSTFYGCSGFTGSLTIPNSVTSIGSSAFQNCSGFTGAVFEGQVPTPLIAMTFRKCTAILEYDFTNCTTVPSLYSTNAFEDINTNCQIKVPLALEASWKAATNWTTYADYIVGV